MHLAEKRIIPYSTCYVFCVATFYNHMDKWLNTITTQKIHSI